MNYKEYKPYKENVLVVFWLGIVLLYAGGSALLRSSSRALAIIGDWCSLMAVVFLVWYVCGGRLNHILYGDALCFILAGVISAIMCTKSRL